jgi:hypothetical protein
VTALPTTRLVLPFASPPLTANDARRSGHWSEQSRAKAEVAAAVIAVGRAARVPVYEACTVTLIWYTGDRITRDCDGLFPMLKACLDALTPARMPIPAGVPLPSGGRRKRAHPGKPGLGVIADDNCSIVRRTSTEIRLASPPARLELIIEPV